MAQCEIENITPFNDTYYVNCFYLSFFTAVKYFNGSIFSYIANDHFVYNINQTSNGLSLEIEKQQVLSFPELAQYNGINIDERYDYCSNVIDFVKDSILEGSLVILSADAFYYKHPYHDLFYLKEHHPHVILLYGFDSERKIFKTAESNGFQWDTNDCFYKHEISFEDLITCHKGTSDHLTGNSRVPILLKLSKDNSIKNLNNDPHFYRSTMIDNLKANKNSILKGLQNISILADNVEQFDIDESTCFGNKVASLSNEYKLKKILGEEGNIPVLKDIVDMWKMIEVLIYKTRFKEVCDKSIFISKLHGLHKMESSLYESLFSSF